MNTENIKSELINLIPTLFNEKGFDTDLIEYVDLVNDLGMDSITFISMVVEIENFFDITVPDDLLLMDNYKNIDNIVKIIEDEKLSQKRAEVVSDV